MATATTIYDYVKNKMINTLKYDETVVLGTLLVILRSNETNYETHFASVVTGGSDTNLQILMNLETTGKNYFDPNAKNIFGFVKEVLLKTIATPRNSSSVTTEIELDIVNDGNEGIKIKFDNKENTGAFDAIQTKTNFEKNFINLAQVFYECGFGTIVQEAVLTDQATSFSPAKIADLTEINSVIQFCKDKLTKLIDKKSLHVIYCNGASVKQRFKEKDFNNLPNVKFTTNIVPGRCITSIKDYANKNGAATHTIVFLDGISFLNIIEINNLKDVVFQDRFADIIIYDSKIDRKDIEKTHLTDTDNIKFTLINKGDIGTSTDVNTSMFRGTEIVKYVFNVDNSDGVKIGKDPDDSTVKVILDYYLFSKIVVHITTD
jgi:hypothetical protein